MAGLMLAGCPPPAYRPANLRLAFLGDVMLGRGIAQDHQAGGWEAALAILAPELRAADFSMANLESPITTRALTRPAYDLRAPAVGLAALSFAGVNVLTLANNHSMDAGPAGVLDTRQALAKGGFGVVGPAAEVCYFNINGYTLAVLALDDVSAPIDLPSAQATIAREARRSDLVIVSIHWGMEYNPGPTPRQRYLAAQLVQAGAGLIVGQHPHVLQSAAWLPRPGRSDQTLVVYSLGNALFDQPAPPDAERSALLRVDWGIQGIQSVNFIPFQIDAIKGQVEFASPANAALIRQRLAH